MIVVGKQWPIAQSNRCRESRSIRTNIATNTGRLFEMHIQCKEKNVPAKPEERRGSSDWIEFATSTDGVSESHSVGQKTKRKRKWKKKWPKDAQKRASGRLMRRVRVVESANAQFDVFMSQHRARSNAYESAWIRQIRRAAGACDESGNQTNSNCQASSIETTIKFRAKEVGFEKTTWQTRRFCDLERTFEKTTENATRKVKCVDKIRQLSKDRVLGRGRTIRFLGSKELKRFRLRKNVTKIKCRHERS